MQSLGRQVTSMQVIKLILQETGTYEPLYMRPYVTHVSGYNLDSITQRIASVGHQRPNADLLSGVASDFCSPSAVHMGQIYIPNGWDTRRLRFVMEVGCQYSTGTYNVYYLQGYTTFQGADVAAGRSEQVVIAPEMEFIVNSFICVTRVPRLTPNGIVEQDIISESSQLLCDTMGMFDFQHYPQSRHLLRPQDLFMGVEYNYATSGLEVFNQEVLDLRPILRGDAVKSNRTNNVPANYLSRVLDTYITSQEAAQYGQSESNVMANAVKKSAESTVFENPFFRAISEYRGMATTNTFTYSELLKCFPETALNTVYTATGKVRRTMRPVHEAGMTDGWEGSDHKTRIATILSQAVPTLMMELMINFIHFRSDNHQSDGSIRTDIMEAKSMTTADMSAHYRMFVARLESEVFKDITYNNTDRYMLDMSVDLYGETWISIAWNDYEMVPFTAPSFCDNLFTPVLTPNRDHYAHIVHDVDQLLGKVVAEDREAIGFS